MSVITINAKPDIAPIIIIPSTPKFKTPDLSVINSPDAASISGDTSGTGEEDAGAYIDNTKDLKTGLPIISLYGENKKPSKQALEWTDLVVFDIQDVGARFYTYISAMHNMMNICAELEISFLVLDRPNPNSGYIDGPVLEMEYQSYIGMHEIPIVHALTVGELARMIKGEKWIENSNELNLDVIKVDNWDHTKEYELPIRPSPNLPNQKSVLLYPSLCLFEQTTVSIGRGTPYPFQVIGHPNYNEKSFSFTPVSVEEERKPKYEGNKSYGIDLRLSLIHI